MRNFFSKLVIGIVLFLEIAGAYAASPLWTFMPLTLTSISLPGNQTTPVFISYKVTNQAKKTHTLIMNPIPGITQETSESGSCPNPFTLNSQQSCTLSLRVIGAKLPGNVFGGPVVCQQGSTLQCYQPSLGNSLRIIKESNATYTISGSITGLATNGLVLQNNGSENLTVSAGSTSFQFATPVNLGGGYNVTILQQPPGLTCTVNNGSGTNVTANVTNISIVCTPLFVYVADESSQLWHCPINSATGTFNGSCTALTNSPAFLETTNVTLQAFNGITYAYVSDYTDKIWQCPLNTSTGGFEGACIALTNSTAFIKTSNVTFQSFNGITYAYVAAHTNALWQCPINPATGTFSGSCTALTNTTAFQATFSVNFQSVNGNRYAYVSDLSNTLWQCPINTITGTFSGACVALTNSPAFYQTNNVTFQSFNGSAYAYVSDASDTVWQCPFNASTGTFNGACTALTNVPAFALSGSVTFQSFDNTTYAYVGDDSNNLWQCPINTSTGAFNGSCVGLTNSPDFFAVQSILFSFF